MSAPKQVHLLPAEPPAPPRLGYCRRKLRLNLFGLTVDFAADVPDARLRLCDIVPLAQQVTDRVVELSVNHAIEQGGTVYCDKGCCTCCWAFLLGLSAAEAASLVESLSRRTDRQAQQAIQWFDSAAKACRDEGVEVRLRQTAGADQRLELVRDWWLPRGERCPFLASDACSIYAERFMACRTFMSLSPPQTCLDRKPRRVPLPLNVFEAMVKLESELTSTPPQVVLLPTLSLWASEAMSAAQRTWRGPALVDRFFDMLAHGVAAEAPG